MSEQSCLVRNEWVCGEYLRTRSQELVDATVQHVGITVASVLIGVVISLPLALLARRGRVFAAPVLGVTTVVYSIPSLAMFSLLLPLFGLSASLVVTGLVLYSLTILVRNILAGLQSVPEEATEAARGMGYGPLRLFWEVELPLALPALLAGVRIATVSTVALTTVGAIVDYGGLGTLILDGLDSDFKAQVLTASVLCVVLAILADLLLLGLQRRLTPWTRATAVRSGRRLRLRLRGAQAPTAEPEPEPEPQPEKVA
ncbi:ABC transporter permease subunit [Streptomyces sp. SID5785]|uniref:ABC transporter permease subunit n=1 Tax=Streptomyces sp. SID5785 TaxID=2690309 RepID=UPI0013612FAB|nr:ABC transporter permease subunit [Streptomyces sp. SID5785]